MTGWLSILLRADLETLQVFGADVDGLAAGTLVPIGPDVFGAPLRSTSELPPGQYDVQATLHVYETYHLATGHTVKLPSVAALPHADISKPTAPGNLYSQVASLTVGATSPPPQLTLNLTETVPPVVPPVDTDYIKHVQIKSELLSAFYNTEIRLGAHVLLPEGFDSHPDARYPLALNHGHFPADFAGWRPELPDENLEPDVATRFAKPIPGDPQEKGVVGYNRIQQEEYHKFYQQWTGPDFPRFLVVEVQHACPYFDDSHAVNSASLGPWGDAIMYELLPLIEHRFRGIGEGWARFTYGGSTGGWEALAVQVKYPEEFNGCFASCPDPVDFRAYIQTNIYEDSNMYFTKTEGFRVVAKPAVRNMLGHIRCTMEQRNHCELVNGTKNRSGAQYDIWEAVFSPQGDDGYPKRLYDKLSGVIDHEVASYWRENFDLSHIIGRDWDILRPKLNGKIHVYTGTMDNFYLNNAVYILEARLNALAAAVASDEEPFTFDIEYGERAEHCWNGTHPVPTFMCSGRMACTLVSECDSVSHPVCVPPRVLRCAGDQENGNHISRLRYNTMYLEKIMARIEVSAPAGADTSSWRY